jgi:ERCC4-type nuclease
MSNAQKPVATLPAKLDPSQVIAIVDSREQTPLGLDPLRTTVAGLDTGDYSIVGLEHVVRVERKSLFDLVGCVGRERERFQREVDRLLAFPVRVLVVEATWDSIELGGWRGSVTSSQVVGSLIGWQASGLSVQMVGSHERAVQFVSRLLYTVARRRYTELRRAFCGEGERE